MREFSSLQSFARHLSTLTARVVLEQHRALTAAAVVVEHQAKSEIGSYQPAVGPFNAWAPLAGATVEDRVRKGFAPNDPLERTRALADSIEHDVRGTSAYVGSESDVLLYQDQGTETIPPRPVLGPALFIKQDRVAELIGAHTVAGLLHGSGALPFLALAKSEGKT